ncbi:junctional protein associated with coronary artery disease homolog isoform X1 [Scleropages formosus]|uniref:junctional protein associated with coronary artery disease homolog isoform X1 n=1 Tax=Scleropages formosus TaxID=113540 RepID=UPI0010FA63E3|nr:junctional protein associated with coronary artery disease homolog isoform X1 [Scleropages formosus]XP_018596859.2 junctional protein associated with coronary artery disease homolog isoform X1 [Scleropages formosus]XP_018596860.2 junctional protein associated with coronary artery disease homolog isoform X1 [Scleropages formosus]XP_029102181.1 junctional protein associated with coronary artery disease homolog isoform X1 [Scleropages formosus]
MYSVQDLLISHGYKLPQNAPAPCERHPTDCHHEIAGSGSGHGTVNGYETDTGAYVHSRQAPAKGYSSDNECREKNWRREAASGYQGDTQPLGDSLATDSGSRFCLCHSASGTGRKTDSVHPDRCSSAIACSRIMVMNVHITSCRFYDAPKGMFSQPWDGKDVSYWRRRGQDFSILLDHADSKDPRGSELAKAGGMQRAPEEDLEKRWWDDGTEDRKCQSLGTDDWQPAAVLNRQFSDGIHPRPKGKSQSLPRVLSPESLQYVDVPALGQGTYAGRRMNGFSQGPYNQFQTEAGGRDGLAAFLPKPKFSRPLKPPSYEAHQQTRGSSEMLAMDSTPQPLLSPRSGGSCRLDCFAHEPAGSSTEPPVYIPPPSYKRPLLPKGNQRSSCEVSSSSRWIGEPFQQVPVSRESGNWSSRQTGSSWLDYQKDRSFLGRKQVHPGHTEEHLGRVQYIPFDDPRVKHISGGLSGNSLTDLDSARSINKELPCTTVFEQSSQDSAFVPPQGHHVNMDSSKRSQSEHDNDSQRHSGLQKASDNSAESDQSCNKFQKDQPSTALQSRSSLQSASLDQGFCETVTQVKKIEPCTDAENKKSSKRKVNETIFCLVSIPIHSQSNGELSDQKNNDKVSNSLGGSVGNSGGSVRNQSLLSTSSLDSEHHVPRGGVMSLRSRKKASHRKEVIRKPPLILNKCRALQYPGSWPGDQYRDQETQTSSPELSQGPPQDLPNQQAQDQGHVASDGTTDSGAGTDCSTRYGYPMKGQKSLTPSSNSAFSKTPTFSNQLSKSKIQPPQPSGNQVGAECPSGHKDEARPAGSNGQEAFGQFLLKPVSRRPWDAIEELESFNKELQEQFSQQPNVDQCIEDLDEAYKDILELSMSSSNVENAPTQIPEERGPASLPEELLKASTEIKPTFQSWTPATDPEYREVRSAFSKPVGKTASLNRQLREKVPVLVEPGIREQGAIAQLTPRTFADSRALKSDIAVPKESLLKDVGLTVYTEAPGAPRQQVNDAATLTSPPGYEDVCQALQLPRERGTSAEYKFRSVSTGPLMSVKTLGQNLACRSESSFSKIPMERKAKKGNSLPKFSGEKILNVIMVKKQDDRYHSRGGPHCLLNNEPEEGYDTDETHDDASGRFNWRKQLLLAEKHLESLLSKEKASRVPAEDLSNLYEVKCAEGIPENESIEERAARILGIDVPAESLGMVDHKTSRTETEQKKAADNKGSSGEGQECSNEKVTHVSSGCEEVNKKSILVNGQAKETEEVKEDSMEKTPGGNMGSRAGLSPGASEFPAQKPLLSVFTGGDLAGERKTSATSRIIEVLQGKLAVSPCRAVVDRLARMKELDSVSRMRRLSVKSAGSVEEVEEEGEGKGKLSQLDQSQLRNGTVTKREITLASEPQGEKAQPLSDSYDPTQVERV